MSVKYCTKCGHFGTENYCVSCGTELTVLPLCECGQAFYPGSAKYCTSCGKPIKKTSKGKGLSGYDRARALMTYKHPQAGPEVKE